jgi:CO/xanthine dehydrogenase Mo-binding subunit
VDRHRARDAHVGGAGLRPRHRKKLAESQVLGAMIQGVSYALHEQRIMDQRSGRMLNGDFLRYKISGPKDLPSSSASCTGRQRPRTTSAPPASAKPPSVAPPAAIANAVFHALGVPVRHLPITPRQGPRRPSRRPEEG